MIAGPARRMRDQARPHNFYAPAFRLDIYHRYASRFMRWINWQIVEIAEGER